MNILLKIKNWLIRTTNALISFLLFTVTSISVSAHSMGYEKAYRSYSFVYVKIAEEINSSTSQNLKNAISVVRLACKSESDLLD